VTISAGQQSGSAQVFVNTAGPLSVTISGPTRMRSNATCTWTVTAHGGLPPYTFVYYSDYFDDYVYDQTNGSSTFTITGGSNGVYFYVDVGDAADAQFHPGGAGAYADNTLSQDCL
jgi:hypothetical protein